MASAAAKIDRDLVLEIDRIFEATPDRVFSAWTEPEQLAQWWGPKDIKCVEQEMDVREGGAYRIVKQAPDGSRFTVSGVYQEIVPNERIVMTWAWENDGERGHETVVRVTFDPHGEHTRLRLEQKVFQDMDARDKHREGWTSSFNKLDDYVD